MTATPVSLANLQRLRRDGQSTRLFLAIHDPAPLWASTVAAVPATNDKVTEIELAASIGDDYTGFTAWIGTTAGARDVGEVRVRKQMTSTTLAIGLTSSIAWQVGQHVTIMDEVGLWARHPKVDTGGNIWMDEDIEYTDQHTNFAPVVVLGGSAVLLDSYTATFDASDSWVEGSTITGYAWAASGAAIIVGSGAVVDVVAPNAGDFRITCTVTAANGKSTTVRRWLCVYDSTRPPVTQFRLDNCSCDADSGGMSFGVTLWGEASGIRDRARVVLFARDYYGDEQVSIGPLAGREHILAEGWISGESITRSIDVGSVAFTVHGANHWLGRMAAYPIGFADTTSDAGGGTGGAPVSWLQFQGLTPAKAVFNLVYWRSTFAAVCDFMPFNDLRRAVILDAPGSTSLWGQLVAMTEARVLAKPICDRANALWIVIPGNLLPVADRASAAVQVMELTSEDWVDPLQFERVTVPPCSLLDLQGVFCDSGGGVTPLFSLANGRVFKRYGSVQRVDRILLDGQDQANELAGLYIANLNNEYPRVSFNLPGNYRVFDIAPQQYITVSATDNARGVTWVNKNFWVTGFSFAHEPETGVLTVALNTNAETFPDLAVTGDAPNFLPSITRPRPLPRPGGGSVVLAGTSTLLQMSSNFTAGTPNWAYKLGGVTGVSDAAIDPYDPTQNTAYVAAGAELYKTTSLKAATPVWERVYNASTGGFVGKDPAIYRVACTVAQQGRVYIMFWVRTAAGENSWQQYVARSDNSGATWATYPVPGGIGGGATAWYSLASLWKDRAYGFNAIASNPTSYTSTGPIWGGLPIVAIRTDGGQSIIMSDNGVSERPCQSLNMTYEKTGPGISGAVVLRYDLGFTWTTAQLRFRYRTIVGTEPAPFSTVFFRASSDGLTIFGATSVSDPVINPGGICNDTPGIVNLAASRRYLHVGVFNSNPLTPALTIDISSIEIRFPSGYTPSTVTGAFSVGQHNPNVVYVSSGNAVKRSTNGGATWSDYIPGVTAVDLQAYYNANPSDANLWLVTLAGEVHRTTGSFLGSVLRTEPNPVNLARRIQYHTNDANVLYMLECTAANTYRIISTGNAGSSWSVGAGSLTGAVSIGLWPFGAHNPSTQVVYWVDNAGPRYSTDGGATAINRLGTWAGGWSAPRIIIPLWLS